MEKLSPRHYEAIRRLVCGETNQEIAIALGVHPNTITNWKADPLFAQELERIENQVRARFVEAVAKREVDDPVKRLLDAVKLEALEKNIELMRSAKSESVQQRSAWDILDRAGYPAVQRVEQTTRVVLDDKTAQDITKALEDMRAFEQACKGDGVET